MNRKTGFFFIVSALVLAFLLVFVRKEGFSFYTHAQTQKTLINHTELESSAMTTVTGQCSPGVSATDVTFYCNDSARYGINSGFATVPGTYEIDINGASSNSSAAGITVFVDNINVGTVNWSTTTKSIKSVTFTVTNSGASKNVKFMLTTDAGQNDTIVDWYELYYLGVPPPTPAPPSPPAVGAYQSGIYRNLFKEAGYNQSDIDAKLNAAWQSLFYGDVNNAAVYRPVGTDMAYIEDINNNDIRSEGMSYGMMIAVQMNKKAEFDRLWKFAKTYMLCPRSAGCPQGSGFDGYFSWDLYASSPYQAKDAGPAPDGEEYFATSLLFAANRWGNNGTFNYGQDAQNILNAMIGGNGNPMFNSNHLVTFDILGNAKTMTDPSYNLPAFYEVWARLDNVASNRTFWSQVAAASRNYWKNASGSNSGRTNGLMPDCTDLSGNAIYGCAGGAIYSYDSWRTISNVAVDYSWWALDSWEKTEADRLQNFFAPLRPSYANQWNLNGTPAGGTTNSTGQIAMNGVSGLAGTTNNVWSFTNDVWNLSVPTGQYRYYDGMLYMMSLLHLSGNFRVWASGGSATAPAATPAPTPGTCQDADINQDGKVDGTDANYLLGDFFKTSPSHPRSDVNRDGVIDLTDYGFVAKYYTQTCI